MFSSINALRFSGLKAAPAAAPIAQSALRFAANHDNFTLIHFGAGPNDFSNDRLQKGNPGDARLTDQGLADAEDLQNDYETDLQIREYEGEPVATDEDPDERIVRLVGSNQPIADFKYF